MIIPVCHCVQIVFVGLLHDTNLGDPAIFEMTRRFVEDYCQKHQIKVSFGYIDIGEYKIPRYSSPLWNRYYEKNLKRFYRFIYRRSFTKYDRVRLACKRTIKKRSASVIFVGGSLIKYKYQEYFHKMIHIVLNRSEQMNVPVMFSGIGVEGYDDNNEICRSLKATLKHKCIKTITVRDNIEALRQYYLDENSPIRTVRVPDAVCSIKNLYPPSAVRKKSTVGLNVMRNQVFVGHGIPISNQELLKLYSDLYKQLLKSGKKCLIFTNGNPRDQEFAEELVSYLNTEENASNLLCPRPQTVPELINTITQCEAVIATRLHAGIIAYAYETPFVGLVWNQKQLFFGESIGRLDRFFNVSEFHAERIVMKLLHSIETGYPADRSPLYKESNQKELENFLFQYVNVTAQPYPR